MLISISIKNFKSVRDTEIVSFDAVKDTRQDDTRLIEVDEKTKLLKTLAIIGPNGAGKSSIVRALEAMKAIVTAPEDDQNPLRHLIGSSFAFGETKGMPSAIAVDFITSAGDLYRYRMLVDMNRIFSESLYKSVDGVKKMVYARRFHPKLNGYRCTFGKIYEYEERRELTRKLGKTRTVLQSGAKFNLPLFTDVYSWFVDTLDIKPIGFASGSEAYLVKMLTEHPDWSKKLVDFLWSCDITDIKEIMVKDGHPLFIHSNVSQKYGSYFLGESLSLRRLVTIGASIFEAYFKTKTMFFDDFGMMLHPYVVQHAIKLFEEANATGKSQLVVIDCNSSALKDGLLRRDGVYFAEKTAEGTTHYYSLADFKYSLRRLNTPFDYLNGAYGALPIMSEYRFDK